MSLDIQLTYTNWFVQVNLWKICADVFSRYLLFTLSVKFVLDI